MMRLFGIMLPVLILLFAGCTGDESTEVDKTPPFKPDLLHHLGDTGDGGITYEVEYPEGTTPVTIEDLNDENNGIDAVAGVEDIIRLQWAPFADSDVDFIRVWRYRKSAWGIEDLSEVDSVKVDDGVSFTDYSLDDPGNTAVNNIWYYYIDVFDTSGNHTVSDTVSYYLLEKPDQNEPSYHQTVTSQDLSFTWRPLTSGLASRYRVLLFDEIGNMLWFYDETDTDPEGGIYLEVDYNATTVLPDGVYYWRVDAFGDYDVTETSGAGSESTEIEFYVQ